MILMKTKPTKSLLILELLGLLTGCESYDHRAASVSPDFPPAAATPDNSPDLATQENHTP
jgi:hypothetical protein